jgi:hypothetical protein
MWSGFLGNSIRSGEPEAKESDPLLVVKGPAWNQRPVSKERKSGDLVADWSSVSTFSVALDPT